VSGKEKTSVKSVFKKDGGISIGTGRVSNRGGGKAGVCMGHGRFCRCDHLLDRA